MREVASILSRVISPDDWIVLGASAAVIVLMVAVAAVLGFRSAEKLDEARLATLAAAEGAVIEGALVSERGNAGLARLAGGRVLAARVMADGVSARAAKPWRLRVRGRRVSIMFDDVGFPPLRFSFKQDAPAWLIEMAQMKS